MRNIVLMVAVLLTVVPAAPSDADTLPQGASTWKGVESGITEYTHIVRKGNKVWLGATAVRSDTTCYYGSIQPGKMRLKAVGGEGSFDDSTIRVRYRVSSGILKIKSRWHGNWSDWSTSKRIKTEPKLRQLCKYYAVPPSTKKFDVCRSSGYPFGFLLSTAQQNTANARVWQAVESIQRLLREIGVEDEAGRRVVIDGSYGPQTASAVRQFQRRHHLIVDGKVGAQTWKSLSKQC